MRRGKNKKTIQWNATASYKQEKKRILSVDIKRWLSDVTAVIKSKLCITRMRKFCSHTGKLRTTSLWVSVWKVWKVYALVTCCRAVPISLPHFLRIFIGYHSELWLAKVAYLFFVYFHERVIQGKFSNYENTLSTIQKCSRPLLYLTVK